MKDEVSRTVEKIKDKVFMVTHSNKDLSKDGRSIFEEKTIRTEVNNIILDEYERDREDQFDGFKKQEKENNDKLKSIEKQLKKYGNERGYTVYKKNYEQYEIFENFIENKTDVTKFLTGAMLKQFKNYEKKRDMYKNFYVTMIQEQQLDSLMKNLEVFKDIWEEDKLFIDQIKEARGLVNDN